MSPPPIPMVYEGAGVFRVLPRFMGVAADHYGQGEVVSLVPHQDRSHATHAHQFAWLNDAWANLPDHLQDQFPTAEHLRKWALIKAGYYDEQRIDVGSKAGALRVAQAIRSFPGEDFSAVVVRGPLVVVRRPKSQSRAAMDKVAFQTSKTALMVVVAELLGIEPETLGQHAGKAA
jgi:hypothetical protein